MKFFILIILLASLEARADEARRDEGLYRALSQAFPALVELFGDSAVSVRLENLVCSERRLLKSAVFECTGRSLDGSEVSAFGHKARAIFMALRASGSVVTQNGEEALRSVEASGILCARSHAGPPVEFACEAY